MKQTSLKQIIVSAKLRHLGLSNKQISEQLGIEIKTVEDALSQSPQYTELKYNIKGDKKYEIALMEKFDLINAVVVETGDEDTGLAIVAQAAANYFMEIISNNGKVALSSGVFLLGIGNPIAERGNRAHSFIQMAEAATPRAFTHYVKKYHLVGEINNQVYDAEGNDRTSEIPGLDDYIINILKLDEIKKLAMDRTEKKVIAIATGERKSRAIKAAIQNGFANILITAKDDAIRLLKDE